MPKTIETAFFASRPEARSSSFVSVRAAFSMRARRSSEISHIRAEIVASSKTEKSAKYTFIKFLSSIILPRVTAFSLTFKFSIEKAI